MNELGALSLPDAQKVLIEAAQPVATEVIATDAALGRVLADDVMTSHAFPDTRRSAVDGYAVNQIDLNQYRIVATLGAGELPQHTLGRGEAAAVMTGATVPEGSVAVVRVEDTVVDGEILIVQTEIRDKENINRIGEEMAAGATVLQAGTRLSPVKHSVLCCTGIAEVRVYRRPRVGILITGDEVLQLGSAHQPGSVYDSNRHFLVGCLAQMGISCTVLGPVKDNADTIRRSVEQLSTECDLVISSGGVSMGKYDFIRPLLHSSGFRVLVNHTKIKPGRPLIVARKAATLFFGMPGYPAACLVNFFYFLLPTVKKLMGLKEVLPPTRRIRLADDLKGRKGRWDVLRVRLQTEQEKERAYRLKSQLTSHFMNMGECDGLVLLNGDCERATAGDEVTLLDFARQF
ncbi:molybdopterin molybdotransferase [Desulfuromusa kysingii]|uniref:Molybdopterin molybdenumtransferase n=2 Tax=Desulfuromusa kysingii TaxID=37625 RepID=A0A1H4A1C8_9BACT|nr:molybdopterin molybdotransferase [Desulfuromusa kysingii]